MFLTSLTESGAVPVLDKVLAFTEARNKMLATNIANITTPGYRTKQLDVASFQKSLREASRRRAQPGEAFRLEPNEQVRQDAAGFLEVTPSEEPAENLLFHDGTNARVERQMALLAENGMTFQLATELLQNSYAGLAKAIRGRTA